MIFTLDTAATCCIMSHKTAQKYGFKILESDVQVKVAHNELIKVVGKTEILHVEVKGHTCELEMFILDNDEYECLLGLSWFLAVNCAINPSERSLRFNGETFSIDDSKFDLEDNENETVLFSELLPIDDDDFDINFEWREGQFMGINPETDLNSNQMTKIAQISQKIRNGFASNYKELGRCKLLPFKIKLLSDQIVHIPQYRRSLTEQAIIQEEVDKLLEAGLISISNSPYSAPTLLVPKKNGKKRMVIDWRCLNKITEPENLPMPLIKSIFDRLSGAKYFTCLDLASGYLQCELDEGSRKYTAFCTATNKYENNVLPFGVRCAPGHFVKMMNMVIGNFPWIQCYIDDLIIFSNDFESHCSHILQLFDALKKANLKVNAEKCRWFCTEVHLLGYIISGSTIKMDSDKVKAISERLAPTNIKEMQTFLGGTGYYRNNIKDYAAIAKPIYDLLKKDTPFIWGAEQQEAFETLKKKLVEYPILRMPMLDKPFTVISDSSAWAVGGCLVQYDPIDNREYVVEYYSRLLKNAERYYSVAEKELLAIIATITQWRVYLCNKFTVISDAKALSFILNNRTPNLRFIRWLSILQSFNFDIVYREGKKNGNADLLSRPVLRPTIEDNKHIALAIQKITEEDEDEITSPKSLCPYDDEALQYFLKYGRHLQGVSQKQKRRVDKLIKHYKIDNGKLMFRKNVNSEEFVYYPTQEEIHDIILSAHNLGHFQSQATISRLKERYFWKNMNKDVENAVARCITCQRNARLPNVYHPAVAIAAESVFSDVICDTSWGYTPSKPDGYTGIFVVIDRLSKFPFAFPLKTKNAEEIASKLIEVICLVSPFKSIQSDRGTEIVNQIVEKILNSTKIDRKVSSAYMPRSQGAIEVFMRTIADSMRKVAEADRDHWPDYLPMVLLSYRTKVHESHGMTPFELVFGKKANFFENWKNEKPNDEVNNLYMRTLEIKKLFEYTIPKAKQNLEKAQAKQKEQQNKRDHVTNERIPIGSQCFIRIDGLLSKLDNRFQGPFYVIDYGKGGNYILTTFLVRK
jgi:hypothetical protein